MHVTYSRWQYLKHVLLSPQLLSDRELKQELIHSTVNHVTDRAVLLDQVGLSLAQRAAFLNIPFLPQKLYNK